MGEDHDGAGLAGGHRLLRQGGLWPYLEKLGFFLVGYGCTTCIGNTGPLPDEISKAINDNDLSVTAVLSGNRNFEGRINPDVKMNYLASPPLVIAYALAGTMDFDFETEPLGKDNDGNDVFLKDIWPSQKEITDTIASSINTEDVHQELRRRVQGRRAVAQPADARAATRSSGMPNSTYVRKPPYFDGMPAEPEPVTDITGRQSACAAGRFGDHRPHLPGRQHQGGHSGRAVPRRSTAWTRRTTTPTARGAATTR